MKTENQKEQSRTWLANIIASYIENNPLHSLRTFAKKVDVSPAMLSRILSGKRNLTIHMATKIADALVLNIDERVERTDMAQGDLTIDCFNAMKDWYHYGVTQLLNLKDFREDHKWMASMLSITELEVKFAIERLLRLEVLDRDEHGFLFKTNIHFTTSTEVASSAIRHFQKQILKKALTSLEEDDINQRDISSITFAVNEENFKEAKKEIKKFRLKMQEILGDGEKTRVYNLGIQLIPLSKSSKCEI